MKSDQDRIEKFRLAADIRLPASRKSDESSTVYRPLPGEKFIMGPLSLHWFAIASRKSGAALTVALILWYRHRLEKTAVIHFNQSRWKTFGISRDSARRGLASLEQARLVSVKRRSGCVPRVTLLLNNFTLGRNNGNGKESSVAGAN